MPASASGREAWGSEATLAWQGRHRLPPLRESSQLCHLPAWQPQVLRQPAISGADPRQHPASTPPKRPDRRQGVNRLSETGKAQLKRLHPESDDASLAAGQAGQPGEFPRPGAQIAICSIHACAQFQADSFWALCWVSAAASTQIYRKWHDRHWQLTYCAILSAPAQRSEHTGGQVLDQPARKDRPQGPRETSVQLRGWPHVVSRRPAAFPEEEQLCGRDRSPAAPPKLGEALLSGRSLWSGTDCRW